MASPEELRKEFDSKFENEKPAFHPADLQRIKDDAYLKRFIGHNDGDLNASLGMLWSTLEWRQSMDVNNLNEKTVNMDYICEGAFFPHGRDKDGCQIMVFISKMHNKSKNMDELKKCIIYWFERLQRKDNGKKITLFFNTEGSGLSHVDMDFVKFLLGLFKLYYPNFLNNILAFEVPWILNAAFKIIKQLLPPKSANKLKFVTRANLTDYIELDHVPKAFGGKSDYVFKFEPETKAVAEVKKVKFQDGGDSVEVTPPEMVVFNKAGDEFTADITVKNISDSDLAFKIRTTCPEKFRVKPNASVLAKGAATDVNIIVVPEQAGSNFTREKFLILTVCIPNLDIQPKELADIWKKSDSKKDEYKLKCSVASKHDDDKTTSNRLSVSDVATGDKKTLAKIDEMQKKLEKLNRNVDRIIMFNYVLLFFSTYIFWLCFTRL